MTTLLDVGRANWTDKGNYGYLNIYESLWEDLKNKPVTLLEIGVYNGNSMRTWCAWFTNATIIGIDNNPGARSNESCAELRVGNQADENFMIQTGQERGPFDIVIDDGGHIWKEQQASFKFLWPFVKSGGMYIIEDLGTSADEFWSHGSEINTVDFLSKMVSGVVLEDTNEIKSLQFYRNLVVIFKK